jgi:predicted negative regulator of RcsB-dependent stress response
VEVLILALGLVAGWLVWQLTRNRRIVLGSPGSRLSKNEMIISVVVLVLVGLLFAWGALYVQDRNSNYCDETCAAISQLPPVPHPLRGQQ